jgi:hypothetical protein
MMETKVEFTREEQLAKIMELLNNESNLKQPRVLKIKHISSPWQLDEVKDAFVKICGSKSLASKWVELHKTEFSEDNHEVAVTLSKDIAEDLAKDLNSRFFESCSLLAFSTFSTSNILTSPIVEVKEVTKVTQTT